jgi:hypothetical protein
MRFEIKCSTFARLASICSFFEPTTPQELKEQINTLRLEKVNGKTIAIITNQKIAAIEILPQYEPGEHGKAIHIVLDPALISQCKMEAFLDGSLFIDAIPEIATAMARTSSGWGYPGNACHWFSETVMDDWREWSGDKIKKSDGIMAWRLAHVQALFEASPSGHIYFPRHIDATKPVVLRDKNHDGWVGLFIPKPSNTEQQLDAAELPDWWGKK